MKARGANVPPRASASCRTVASRPKPAISQHTATLALSKTAEKNTKRD